MLRFDAVLVVQGLDGSYTSLTRIRSISQAPSVSGPLGAGRSVKLEHMPSIDGLSIVRTDTDWEGSSGLVRVLSCLDSSCQPVSSKDSTRRMEAVDEGEQDAPPSTKADIEDRDGVVVSVEQ